jgi:hypothetical protein
VLLKCIEDWRKWLDKGESIGCLMIDLSKAFDSLPHGLLLAKLHAYGLNIDACHLIHSYLTGRQQRVKMGVHRSNWQTLTRGVPQGSILGPLLFNVFLNDYFSFINEHECVIYNYADDNTLCSHDINPIVVKENLETSAISSIKWFDLNCMNANPNKFQSIVLSRQKNVSINITINGNVIESSDCIKLLGVFIDNKLLFDCHVSSLCKKVGRQLNALCRMSRFLNAYSMMNIYNAYIMSNFNYAPTVWHLCGRINTRKVERLQKRALRIIYKDYVNEYPLLLSKASKSTLHLQRTKCFLTMMFKIMNDLGKPFTSDYFEKRITTYDFRSMNTLVKPKPTTTTFGINSFLYQGVTLWNMLTNEMRQSDDLVSFSNALKVWSGPQCACGSCLFCYLL